MLRLVLKDFSVARWLLLAGLPLYAVQAGSMSVSPPAFLLATVVFTGLLAFGSIALEEVQETEILWASLPVSRRAIVVARYLTVLAGATLGLAISFVVGQLAARLLAGTGASPARPDPATYAILLAVFLLAASGYLPLLFRFGAGRGLVCFAAAAVGLLLIFGALAYLALPSGGRPTPEQIEAAEAWVERWRGTAAAGLLVAAAVASVVSAWLSVRVYRGRDL